MFAGYDDGQCIGWDTLLRRPTLQLTGHENRVTSLGVSPDGTAVCTGSWDTVLRVRAVRGPAGRTPRLTRAARGAWARGAVGPAQVFA